MSFSVCAASTFEKAFIQGEVVSDAVFPSRSPSPEVGIVVEDPLVDVSENQFLSLGAEDGHSNERDVAVTGLRIVLDKLRPQAMLVQTGLGVRVQQRAPGVIDHSQVGRVVVHPVVRHLELLEI